MRLRRVLQIIILIAPAIIHGIDEHEVQMEQMRKEIRELESKTSEIKKKLEHTRKKATQDSASYQKFILEHSQRVERLAAEYDSIKNLVGQLEQKRTALEDKSASTEKMRNNFLLLASSVSEVIADNCERVTLMLENLKKYNIDRQISALRFLSGEIKAGTVDAIEGMERYYQIIQQIEKQSQVAETWTGPSPSTILQGNVTYLRLGFFWLACINADNSAALLWDDNTDTWKPVENTNHLLAIRDAVSLIAGRSAPKLIGLPFNHSLVAEIEGGN